MRAAETPEALLGLGDAEASVGFPAARAPRPASKIAENVTVITAADIERLNAHTLADVLQTIPGIQLDYVRTPGSFSFFNMQGALNTTVLVLQDGVRLNDFQLNMADPGLIPVQQIERIEIVRGAASAAWGPALGGVINIVTKTPDPERPVAGTIAAAIGTQATADSRVELHGTVGRFGYYLTGGNLYSDGLLANNGVNLWHAYGKFSWQLPGSGTISSGISYSGGIRGRDEGLFDGAFPVHDDSAERSVSGFLQLSQPLAPNLQLALHGYVSDRYQRVEFNDLVDGQFVPTEFAPHAQSAERGRGVDARLTWGNRHQGLTVGAAHDHAETRTETLLPTPERTLDRTWDRWSLYANGTYALGPLTLLPGIRYDHTGLVGDDYTSYTLGATWQLTERTLLRAYGARGYGYPVPRATQQSLMRVDTVQAGIETEEIPLLWLKGTWFFNRVRDYDPPSPNQDRQGFELEVRTNPLFGFALTGGYTFTHAKDVDTGERLQTNSSQTVPPHLVKLGLRYDNADLGLRGTLTGNYVSLNAMPGFPARSGGIVWDLHLNWKLLPQYDLSPEVFFSGRNLLDNVQTVDTELFLNTPRWFEGGLRFKF